MNKINKIHKINKMIETKKNKIKMGGYVDHSRVVPRGISPLIRVTNPKKKSQ